MKMDSELKTPSEVVQEEINKLRTLSAIICRLERSSFAYRLKQIPQTPYGEVAQLVEMDRHNALFSKSSVSELATLLKSVTIQFMDEENSAALNTETTQVKDRGEDSLLTKFTLFPELPVELRLKIWGSALPPGPRIIEIYNAPPSYDTHITKQNHAELALLLTANVEAYDAVKSRYRRVQHLSLGISTYREESIIFLDDSRDVLYMNSTVDILGRTIQAYERRILESTADIHAKLTCISLYASHFNTLLIDPTERKFQCEWLPKMTNLEKIILTINPRDVRLDDMYRGHPLEFVEYKADDEHAFRTNIRHNWAVALAVFPEMKGLHNVRLVFVEPKRIDRPKLLSNKIDRLAMMVRTALNSKFIRVTLADNTLRRCTLMSRPCGHLSSDSHYSLVLVPVGYSVSGTHFGDYGWQRQRDWNSRVSTAVSGKMNPSWNCLQTDHKSTSLQN